MDPITESHSKIFALLLITTCVVCIILLLLISTLHLCHIPVVIHLRSSGTTGHLAGIVLLHSIRVAIDVVLE